MSGIVIAGTASGVGKTLVTLGLISVFRKKGLKVQPFKVGPDFIDPGYHTLVSGLPSRNLDGWMLSPDKVQEIFTRHSGKSDLAIVEGVMGLFDGIDGKSEEGSTAQIAKLLNLPVILVVDTRSMARSVGAVVYGFEHYDPKLNVAGVIFNRVGSTRHYEYLREAVADRCRAQVLGYLSRHEALQLPERHLGLVTAGEFGLSGKFMHDLNSEIESHVDIDKILSIAKCGLFSSKESEDQPASGGSPVRAQGQASGSAQAVGQALPDHSGRGACEDLPEANRSGPTPDAGPGHGGIGSEASRPPYSNAMGAPACRPPAGRAGQAGREDDLLVLPHGPPHLNVRLAVARDEAFSFYYPDNLDLLSELGVELCDFSPMRDTALPERIDGIYLGGGYPEVYADQLAANQAMCKQIRQAAEEGLPIYAECGGLMYLTRAIQDPDGHAHAMVGLLPTEARMLKKRKALGYVEVRLSQDCLLGKAGWTIRGHEYHYSELTSDLLHQGIDGAYELWSRKETTARKEGYQYRNVLASYVHLHFGSNPKVAQSFVDYLRIRKNLSFRS